MEIVEYYTNLPSGEMLTTTSALMKRKHTI